MVDEFTVKSNNSKMPFSYVSQPCRGEKKKSNVCENFKLLDIANDDIAMKTCTINQEN